VAFTTQCNSEKFQPGQIEILTKNREGINATLFEKEKRLHWRNISGFQQCNFYSDIMFCCRYILLALKSQLFRLNWPKLGSFSSITLQKKMKIEISKKLALGKKKLYNIVFKF